MEPEYNKHHRKCRSNGGKSTPENTVLVLKTHHDAWHCLTGNKKPVEIAKVFNETYLDPDFKLVVVPAEKYDEVLQFLFFANILDQKPKKP